MQCTRNRWSTWSASIPLLIWSLITGVALVVAAPLDLSHVPLELNIKVEPNVLLIFDNSSSMEGNELVTNIGTDDSAAWYDQCSVYNAIYYNPDYTYTPWIGLDKNGQVYQDMPVTAARKNPYDPGEGTQNLTSEKYYTWTDLDLDGKLDSNEGTEFEVGNQTAAVQQNFANWYSYYRLRNYTAKAAFGHVIAAANNVRMGLVTIHNDSGPRTPIDSLNPDPASGFKKTVLNALYSIDTHSNTPLRQALFTAGKYIECDPSNGISTTCPVLSLNNGGACQQNYSILISDGYYNQSLAPLGNIDGPGLGNTLWDGGAYADSKSDTLADVAMYFYERDLHPSLPDQVPTQLGIDNAPHQHMVSYMVSFGLLGSLSGPPTDPSTAFAWPDPTGNGRIDDMLHAAYNSRGQFFTVFNAEDLSTALEDVLDRVAAGTGAAAPVAMNTHSLQTDSHLYHAFYDTAGWSGQVAAHAIASDGTIAATPTWKAAEALDTQDFDTGRVILTSHHTSRQGIAFRWNALDAAQQSILNTHALGTLDAKGQARTTYLRGNRADEGTGNNFRKRTHVLGDIIGSAPYYVGKPPFSDDIGTDYDAFRSTYESRTPMLYFGANDGMLHGVDANTGNERLAYIPNKLFPQLSQLTSTAYTHRSYVDSSPTVQDAYGNFGIRCGGGSPCWRSVLVGGLGHGGQGLYALDVTNPSAAAESNANKIVLWEFTDRDDNDLGYTYSQPSIVRMANGKWAAIIGNGYNNTEADGYASTSGNAVLYIIFLDMGLDGTWTAGTDYIKLDTYVGDVTTPNGLATPAPVDLDGDFTAEAIYAGDLRGNLWKFDVSDSNPSNWVVASNTPLLTATSPVGTPQPITVRPEVGYHNQDPTGVLIYVGTGQYLEPTDLSVVGVPTQTFYAVWDKNEPSHASLDRSNLLQQTVIDTGSDYRATSANPIDWSTHMGWYLDLPTSGERHVTGPVLRADRIVFTTLIPVPDPCTPGGKSWLMELNNQSGSRLIEAPFDRNNDNTFDSNDFVTVTEGGETKSVAESGRLFDDGALSRPTILNMGDKELKVSSSATGSFKTMLENPGREARGRQAWRTLP